MYIFVKLFAGEKQLKLLWLVLVVLHKRLIWLY